MSAVDYEGISKSLAKVSLNHHRSGSIVGPDEIYPMYVSPLPQRLQDLQQLSTWRWLRSKPLPNLFPSQDDSHSCVPTGPSAALQLDENRLNDRTPASSPTSIFDQLPDELLSEILWNAATPTKPDDPELSDAIERGALAFENDILQLCHISRRFAIVSRATPSLWTTITRLKSLDLLNMFLCLSSMRSIRFIQIGHWDHLMLPSTDIHDHTPALKLLMAHAERLEALSFRPVGHAQGMSLYHSVLSSSALQFPRLCHLDILCPYDNFKIDFGDTPIYGNLLGDRFPNLSSVVVPDYMFDQCAIKHLRSAAIIGDVNMIDERGAHVIYPVSDYIDSFIQLPQLETLTCRLNYNSEPSIILCASLREKQTFVSIIRLELIALARASTLFLADFLEYTSFPMVELIRISLYTGDGALNNVEEDVAREMIAMALVSSALSRQHQSFERLQTFFLYRQPVVTEERVQAFVDLDRFMLLKMRNLTAVGFDCLLPNDILHCLGALEGQPLGSMRCPLPLLERICLRASKELSFKTLTDIVRNRAVEGRHSLKDITFRGCGAEIRTWTREWEEFVNKMYILTGSPFPDAQPPRLHLEN